MVRANLLAFVLVLAAFALEDDGRDRAAGSLRGARDRAQGRPGARRDRLDLCGVAGARSRALARTSATACAPLVTYRASATVALHLD